MAAAPLLAFVCTVACGSSSDSGAAPVSEDQFPTALAGAVCDHIQNCCQQSGYPYDAVQCKLYMSQNSLTTLPHDGMRYDANAAGKCVAAVTAAASSCKGAVADACDQIYVGATPPGAACTNSSQCQQPSGGFGYATCDYSSQVCVVVPRGKSGDPCAGDCYTTSTGQHCSYDNYGGSGALCYESDGLFCNYSNVCQPLLHAGDSCDAGGCVKGTYCSSGTGICTVEIAVGQPCPDGTGCVSSAFCNDSLVCANRKADGSACTGPAECLSDACSPGGICGYSTSVVNAATCGGSAYP